MKLFFILLSLLIAESPVSLLQSDPLPLGSKLPKPTLKMKEAGGKLISLSDAKTNFGLLVIFGSNNCSYSTKNENRIKEICTFAQKKNLGVIILNSNEGRRANEDSYQAMQAYSLSMGYRWPYVLDSNSELADSFGASRNPECYLFNGKSILVYHGAIDDNPVDESRVIRHHLKEAINEMLSGKDILIKESRSVGCSIERKN